MIPLPNLSLGFGDKYGPGGSQANTVNNASGNGHAGDLGDAFWNSGAKTVSAMFPHGLFGGIPSDTTIQVSPQVPESVAAAVGNFSTIAVIGAVLLFVFLRKAK